MEVAVFTYSAYWMTPLVPSSLGRGTSLRILPKLGEWGVNEVASF